MGKMKELFMDQQEAQRFQDAMNSYDGPEQDPEDAYYAQMAEEHAMWEQVAAEHDAYMQSVLESGIPVELLDAYGYHSNPHIIDELPTTCRVCGEYTAPGNEYCGTECKEVYHKSISNSGTVEGPEDLPF